MMLLPLQRLRTSPRTTLESLPVPRSRPSDDPKAPDSSMSRTALSPAASVLGLAPGCVYPSIVTGAVIAGRAVFGLIVWTPAPEMLKWIAVPECALAYVIASRSVHDPDPVVEQAPVVSPESLTVTVAADSGSAV